MRGHRSIAKMMTKEEALDWLYQQKKSKKREDLSRIKSCIKELNLVPNYEVIHIAGTNGKGSTASYLSTMLEKKRMKTGLFVSPFVLSFNERIEVNHEFISDSKIIEYILFLKEYAVAYQEKTSDTIPFFELTFLMALKYFKESNIDIAIIECGLGGRLDATNALETSVSIITNIGFDHMAQLGTTLEEIADHKLGITRTGVPCFTCVSPQLQNYFETYALKNKIDIKFIYPLVEEISSDGKLTFFRFNGVFYKTSLAASYQAYNASLAIAVMRHLYPEYPLEYINESLLQTKWPGRFELVTEQIILDGAHNIPGVLALKESISMAYPNRKVKILFTALKDKEYKKMIEILEEITEYFYFTTIDDKRSIEITEFLNMTTCPHKLYGHYKEALEEAVVGLLSDELLVITGSLHFISEVRRELKNGI